MLSPAELVRMASKAGIKTLALTDHDGTDGLDEARQTAAAEGIGFINGIELSVSWEQRTVHIVGLNISPAFKPLREGIEQLQAFRKWRAREIANRLEGAGIEGALEGARTFSRGRMLGRMHFAHFLVAAGYEKNITNVFKRYLVKDRPGHVAGDWATMEDAVSWINGSGGVAVLAHPARYPMTRAKLRRLIRFFIDCGGQAIEVMSGSYDVNTVKTMARHAGDYNLYASVGSDFHDPAYPWSRLGALPRLPAGCKPVWDLF